MTQSGTWVQALKMSGDYLRRIGQPIAVLSMFSVLITPRVVNDFVDFPFVASKDTVEEIAQIISKRGIVQFDDKLVVVASVILGTSVVREEEAHCVRAELVNGEERVYGHTGRL